jgi:nucleotide-binding universal stress UspA family protein
MRRVIIPVDFSPTALNAARFTSQMLAGKTDTQTILYTNYESEDDYDIVKNYLESLKKEFFRKGNTAIEYVMEAGGSFIDNLSRLAQLKQASLITMGITGKSVFEQVIIGSNTLKMIDRKICPVMIIPPDAEFNSIKNIAFASDFKNVTESTPAAQIKEMLQLLNAKLYIVNVSPEHYVSLTDEYQQGKEEFLQLFGDHSPEFYFISMNDFYEAIDSFVKDFGINLLLTIPRKHSNEISLWKSSHTKRLAYRSTIPILATHL